MVFGFALIFYSLGSPVNDAMLKHGFRSDLYVCGTTIFTLGLGDVTPSNVWARALTILEAGTGFGFLAVVMGYFPVLYGAFSRREVSIALLDARAGSPPTASELLRRHSYEGAEARWLCCWSSGSAGQQNCWRAISPIRCFAISGRSIPIRVGSARSRLSSILRHY